MNLLVVIVSLMITAVSWAADESSLYDDHGKRDPLWPLVSSNGAIITYDSNYMISDLALEGIMYARSNSIAIINGQIVKINDTIGKYVVAEINRNSVKLMKEGKEYTLQLEKEE